MLVTLACWSNVHEPILNCHELALSSRRTARGSPPRPRGCSSSRAASRVDGGFGWLDADGAPEAGRPLQLWITTRMTHVLRARRAARAPGLRAARRPRPRARSASAFEDREHGGWFPEVSADGPVRREKEAYPHSFVLLAAASAAMAGRAGGRRAARRGDRASSRTRFWSEDEGACRRVAGTAPGASPRPTAARTRTCTWSRRSWPPATPRATPSGTSAPGGSRSGSSATSPRAHDWRIVEHFDADWRPLPDYNARPSRATRSGPSGSRPATASSGRGCCCRSTPASTEPPDWLLEAARGPVRARGRGRLGRRPAASPTRPTWTGGPSSRDRLHWVVTEAIGAAAALHAVTGEAGYERWYRTLLGLRRPPT